MTAWECSMYELRQYTLRRDAAPGQAGRGVGTGLNPWLASHPAAGAWRSIRRAVTPLQVRPAGAVDFAVMHAHSPRLAGAPADCSPDAIPLIERIVLFRQCGRPGPGLLAAYLL
jgi:hypothetical protein